MTNPVVRTMSEIRFATYLRAAGHNEVRAMELYLWNAKLGAAFHIAIQAIEVSLRNRINGALTSEFGVDWWRSAEFLSLIPQNLQRDLSVVLQRLKHLRATENTDNIVAGLSFGFWVAMLHRRFNPRIWSRQTRLCFPDMPSPLGRADLHDAADMVARLRNRISHHEPLIHVDALGHFGAMSRLLDWICPPTKRWVIPRCEVPRIVRDKP